MRIDDTRPIWIQLADSFRARITEDVYKRQFPGRAVDAGARPGQVGWEKISPGG